MSPERDEIGRGHELVRLIEQGKQQAAPGFLEVMFFAAKTVVASAGASSRFSDDPVLVDFSTETRPFEVDSLHPIISQLVSGEESTDKFQVFPILLDGTSVGFLIAESLGLLSALNQRLLSDIETSLLRSRHQKLLARTSSQLRYKTLEVESLIDIMSILDQSPSITSETYTTLLFTIISVLNASKGMILFRDPSSGVFSPIAALNISEEEMPKGLFTSKRGLLRALTNDEYRHTGAIFGPEDGYSLLSSATENSIVCPIIDHDELVGCVIAIDKETRNGLMRFNIRDLRLCHSLTKKISLVHRNISLFDSLNKSNKLVDSIMSSVTTGLIKLNQLGEIEYLNSAAESILGVSQSDVRDQHYLMVFDQNNELISLLADLETGPQKLFVENAMIIDRGGISRNVNMTFAPVYTESKHLDGFVISFEDLSALSKITATFKRYVSENIVDTVLNDSESFEMGGKQQEVCILFSDLRGFTRMSEKMTPPQIVYVLNQYFEVMIDLVFQHGGVLDKIIGDERMVLYGVPSKSSRDIDNAIATSMKMFEVLEQLNQKIESEGFERLEMGIGINFGEVVSGNIGSTRQMNYTVIGDEVNLASRLCSNALAGELLISRSVYERMACERSRFTEKTPIKVKGKSLPIDIWSCTHSQR